MVLWFSPVHQVSDSDFSMLVSQSLLEQGSFKLDRYFVPRPPAIARDGYVAVGAYQLELVNDHVYYYFPHATSVLSLPYVAVARLFGVKPKDDASTHGEMEIQTSLAALLMAVVAVVFFITGRLLLDRLWSCVVALGGVFASQVWSTASRGLWSHTWNLLLVSLIAYLLMRAETGRHRIQPILLGTLSAWAYFVRPTSSIVIIAITIYLVLYYRSASASFIATLSVWAASFVAYSLHNFGQVLPSYFATSRLDFSVLRTSLPGNLISPSRGMLIYLPWILFTGYLLIRYRRLLKLRGLIGLSLIIVIAEFLVISAFTNWWGGSSYGPRLTIDLLPWLVLLTIPGLAVMLQERKEKSVWWTAELAAGALLLTFSVFIHARGATSQSTLSWNVYPKNERDLEAKMWDWREPQFLAGLIRPAPPTRYASISGDTLIDVTRPESEKYLWLGWGRPEGDFRWTDGRESMVVFALKEIRQIELTMNVAPFILPGRVQEQQLQIELNGRQLDIFRLNQLAYEEIVVTLPSSALKAENTLTFRLPNAVSPESLRLSIDQRQLGLSVKSMRFRVE